MHKTIKKVSDDIESMKFNTAIAAMMTLLNEIYNVGSITKKEFRDLLIILNPFAPHVTEELYQMIGCEGVLDEQEWVTYDEALCKDDTIEIVCQINGKVKSSSQYLQTQLRTTLSHLLRLTKLSLRQRKAKI